MPKQIFLGKECFGVVKPLFSPRKVKLKTASTVKKCHFSMAVKGHFCGDMAGKPADF